MSIFNFFRKSEISIKIKKIEGDIKKVINNEFTEPFWLYHYGAIELDLKYLVIWICVKSDKDKRVLESNLKLKSQLTQVLIDNDYPLDAISHVHIGFESQENVDRLSNGKWHDHFR
jgi:hypothetical protein